MFVRRRPLLRAAVVGGGAYMAGKRQAQRTAQDQEMQAQQDSDTEQSQSAPAGQPTAPSQPAAAAAPSMGEQLEQLNDLHQKGALSDAEFAAAKSRLIGS